MDYLVTGRRRAYAGLTAMALGAVALVGGLSGTAGATDEEPPDPRHLDGNPTCEVALPGSVELIKIEAQGEFPADGTYTEGDFSVTIDIDEVDGQIVVNFSNASEPVNVVIVKAGPGANVFDFDPGVTEAEGLESPKEDSISHITFCSVEDDNGTTTTSEDTTTTSTPDETTTTSTPDETTTTSTPDDSTTTSTPDDSTTTTMGSGVSPTTDDDGGLPVTGSNTGLMVAVGALLLVGGGTLLATSRLRKARGEA